ELEKRALDKTGVKAVLIERLQKSVEADGLDPEEFVIEVAGDYTPSKKSVVKKTPQKKNSKENDELDATVESNNGEDSVISQDEEKVADPSEIVNDSINLSVEDDEDLLIADEEEDAEGDAETEASAVDLESMETVEEVSVASGIDESGNVEMKAESEKAEGVESEASEESSSANPSSEASATQGSDQKENEAPKEGEASPPRPETAPVVVPLTVEDTIKLDTSQVPRPDDNVSLIVHVDDTQNDLDADLVKSSKPGSPVQTNGDGVEKKDEPVASEEKDNEVAKVEMDTKEDTVVAVTAAVTKNGKSPIAADEVKKESVANKAESAVKVKSETTTPAKEAKPKPAAKGGAAKVPSTKNLWVSGLASTTRATDLKTLFSKHGKVMAAKIVTNAKTPMARCYGFVTMSTSEEASKCIQHLHRTELHGQLIAIERAKTEPGIGVKKPQTAAAAVQKKPAEKKTVDTKTVATSQTAAAATKTAAKPQSKPVKKKVVPKPATV
ncbi:Uncharacterised protein PB.7786, partial [Pycnogonum litorale]